MLVIRLKENLHQEFSEKVHRERSFIIKLESVWPHPIMTIIVSIIVSSLKQQSIVLPLHHGNTLTSITAPGFYFIFKELH